MPKSSSSRRPIWAVLGALPLVAIVVGLWIYNATTRRKLAVIQACTRCTGVGKPVESGWVEVLPGDAWSVALGAHAGMVIRGPARFEVAGKERVALSSGLAYAAAGPGARAVVLLRRNDSSHIEGATVATQGAGARLAISASIDGNRVQVLRGAAHAELRTGSRSIKVGEIWQSGAAPPIAPPTATERGWLTALAGSAEP